MFQNPRILGISCFTFFLASVAFADEGRVPLTDPVQLTRLGFPADSRNVYVVKGVELNRPRPSAPEEFGTSDSGYSTVLGNQHNPRSHADFDSTDGTGDIFSVSGSPFFDAQLSIPSGALLESVTWWALNGAGAEAGLTLLVFRVCQSSGPPDADLLGSTTTTGLSGEFTLTMGLPPTTIDNTSCAYVARAALPNAFGNAVRLRKVRASWRRQVSLAPAVATFPNDTPTTHPYFRFIEALAAAGITGGCGPGSYCPSAPITRGEMAVFLSVALGLHWP